MCFRLGSFFTLLLFLSFQLLLAAVQTLGMTFNWGVIQEFVPGRTAYQCKERSVRNSLSDVHRNLNILE